MRPICSAPRFSLAAVVAALVLVTTASAVTKTWDGGAGTNSWHDGANWNPDGVPTSRDDVVLTGAITVVHSSGLSSVGNLSITTGTLVVSGGTLEVAGLFDVATAQLNYTGGAIDAAPLIRAGSSLLIGPSATAAVDFVINGNAAFDGRIHPGQSVWVQGSNSVGAAVLTVADGSSCAGTLTLASVNGGFNSACSIPADTEFIIESGGELVVGTGTGGARTISGSGSLRNEGAILVEADVTLAMSGVGRAFLNFGTIDVTGGISLSGSEVTLATGSVTGSGFILLTNGAFTLSGGALTAVPIVRGSAIDIAPTFGGVATVIAETSNTLINNGAAGATVWVRGANSFGSANLTVVDGAGNVGTIRLESIVGGFGSDLSIPADVEFVNAASGTIEANAGSFGARGIHGGGHLHNHGLLSVEPGITLTMNGPGRQFVNHGSVTIDGIFTLDQPSMEFAAGSVSGSGTLLLTNGSIVVDAGSVTPDAIVRGSTIEVTAGVTGACTLIAEGINTLVDNASSTSTIWVRGSGAVGTASMTIVDGATNAGVIRLESTVGGFASNLFILPTVEFVNASGAFIDVGLGTGGARTIGGEGDLRNDGAIDIASGTTLALNGAGRSVTNHGSIVVDGAFSLNGPVLTLASGSVSGDGTLTVSSGALLLDGGTLTVNAIARTSTINAAAAIAAPATIFAEGASTLLGNGTPSTTIHIRGSSAVGSATLTLAQNLTNAGTIRLESIGSGWTCDLSIPGGVELVNAVTGVLDVRTGTGGNRLISGGGNLVNDGTIFVEGGTGAVLNGVGRTVTNVGSMFVDGSVSMTGPTFVNTGDVIGVGSVLVVGGAFEFTGGAITLEAVARSSTIDVAATVTSASTIIAEGPCPLIAHASETTTIWVRGASSTGSAQLILPAGATNAGTIRLESINAGWSSTLSIPAGSTFTNLASGAIVSKAGTGGARSINGADTQVVNHGLIDPGFPNHLFIAGSYVQSSTGTLFTEYAGPAVAQHSRLNVAGNATLAGSLELVRINAYVPPPATVHTFLNSASRTGVFDNVTTCDEVTVTYDATQAAVQFSVSGIPGDLNGDGVVNGADLGLLLQSWG